MIHAGSGENELPLDADAKNAPNIISVWQVKQNSHRVIEYTQAVRYSITKSSYTKTAQNIIASVAAQLAALPRNHTIQETDLLISLESLTQSYPLTIVLAGLYAHASIALTSVAGLSSDYNMAFQGGLKPTIIIVSSTIMIKAHAELLKANESFLRQLHKSRKASHLAAGTMRVVDKQSPHLIYVSYSGNDTSLSLQDLNDLRIFTDSRIIHSLTSPQVAGAIVQTSPLDYRIGSTSKKSNHFGGPLSCVEIKVIEGESKISDEDYQPTGQLVVSGSAVIGKQEIKTGITAKFGDDHTLQLI